MEALSPGLSGGATARKGLSRGAAHDVVPEAFDSVALLLRLSSTREIGPVIAALLVFLSVTVCA